MLEKGCCLQILWNGLYNYQYRRAPVCFILITFPCKMLFKSFSIFRIQCGSRTTPCDICHNLILVRMMEAHNQLHGRNQANERTSIAKPHPSAAFGEQRLPKNSPLPLSDHDRRHGQPTESTRYKNHVGKQILQGNASHSSPNGSPPTGLFYICNSKTINSLFYAILFFFIYKRPYHKHYCW